MIRRRGYVDGDGDGDGDSDGQRVSNYAARCVAVFLCSSNCLENQDKLFNSRPTRKSPLHVGSDEEFPN